MTDPSLDARPTGPTIDVRWPRPGIAQIVLAGEHDLSSADQLDETLTQALEVCSKLIVDLRDTEFVDSSTIRVLMSARGRAEANGTEFNLLLATTPIVERSLEITGVLPSLNRVFTLDQALGS